MVNVDVKKHLIALVLTVAMFTIGLLIGITTTQSRTSYLEEAAELQKLDYESMQLQSIYITSANRSCPALSKALESNLNNLEVARAKLENYLSESGKDTLGSTKRGYMLAELRYWILAQETKKTCNQDSVLLLYFYRKDELCDACSTQGYILTTLKEKFKDRLLIFSLDADFIEEPLIPIIKENYGFEKAPTIIIQNQKLEGLTNIEELTKTICSYYNTKLDSCK
ncbi:MAG: hypothetical protein AB1571_03185 [Nanoarchaeota archaeon]